MCSLIYNSPILKSNSNAVNAELQRNRSNEIFIKFVVNKETSNSKTGNMTSKLHDFIQN